MTSHASTLTNVAGASGMSRSESERGYMQTLRRQAPARGRVCWRWKRIGPMQFGSGLRRTSLRLVGTSEIGWSGNSASSPASKRSSTSSRRPLRTRRSCLTSAIVCGFAPRSRRGRTVVSSLTGSLACSPHSSRQALQGKVDDAEGRAGKRGTAGGSLLAPASSCGGLSAGVGVRAPRVCLCNRLDVRVGGHP